ncbi:ABC transporter permease [Mycolicibacterium pulveris]|uniref:ABC transporter permease n=1 Tax=Mycolicibacterium pulveris TaxID=36813 RepID=UPI003CF36394
MTTNVSSRSGFLVESLLFAGWYIRRWRSEPLVPLQSLAFPTLLLIVYHTLVSESMTRLTGTNNLNGLVPMCALAGGMLGALGLGFAIPAERAIGLLSRVWTFPIGRASALIGRLIAEGARTLISAGLVTAIGVAMGLRFQGGPLAVIPYLFVPVLVVLVVATVVITLGLRVGPDGNAMMTWVGTASIGMVFGSSGIAPVEVFPSWLHPLIKYQPMSPAIETMRALSEGGPVLGPLMLTLAWVFGLAAVFVPLAIRNYRIAAESAI